MTDIPLANSDETGRPLVALSSIIFDHIVEADGREREPSPGGAGLFAALGIALWAPRTAIVAGIGRDFARLQQGLLADHGIATSGLVERDEHSIQSLLRYAADGSRTEQALRGPDHFARMQIAIEDIPPAVLPAAGTYIFQDAAPAFWQAVHENRHSLSPILWELHEGATEHGLSADLKAAARMATIVSLNRAEATRLLGPASDLDLLQRAAAALGTSVALRVGDQGAYLAADGNIWRIPPVPGPVVDVTGGGNAFSGGLLAGYCARPGDWEHASRCAAVSAAVAIAHVGAPPPIARAQRDAMYALVPFHNVQT